MDNENELSKPQRTHSTSISMPPSPIEAHVHNKKRVHVFTDEDDDKFCRNEIPNSAAAINMNVSGSAQTKEHTKYSYSQPMPKAAGSSVLDEAAKPGNSSNLPLKNIPTTHKLEDKRYDSFKTWSGKLERQLSNLRGKHQEETEQEHPPEVETLPVDRYFAALEGPELDTLRVCVFFLVLRLHSYVRLIN